jgi:hypothetical protein
MQAYEHWPSKLYECMSYKYLNQFGRALYIKCNSLRIKYLSQEIVLYARFESC